MKQLPNILTISRVVVIPIIILLFLIPCDEAKVLVGALFIIASITDYFDGYFARSMHITSSFGRFLDPIADKLLVVSTLFMIAATQGDTYYGAKFFGSNALFAIPAIIIICREIIVSGLREYLAELKVGVPVTRLAKWKTGVQMTAIPFIIFGFLSNKSFPILYVFEDYNTFAYIGTILLWIAAVLTMITGWDYLKSGLKYMNIEPDVMLTPIKKVIDAKDSLVNKVKEKQKEKAEAKAEKTAVASPAPKSTGKNKKKSRKKTVARTK